MTQGKFLTLKTMNATLFILAFKTIVLLVKNNIYSIIIFVIIFEINDLNMYTNNFKIKVLP